MQKRLRFKTYPKVNLSKHFALFHFPPCHLCRMASSSCLCRMRMAACASTHKKCTQRTHTNKIRKEGTSNTQQRTRGERKRTVTFCRFHIFWGVLYGFEGLRTNLRNFFLASAATTVLFVIAHIKNALLCAIISA